MKRKLYITEEQLNKILKNAIKEELEEIIDDGAYLKNSEDGNVTDLGNGDRVGLNPLPDGIDPTTDDIARTRWSRLGIGDRGCIPARGAMTMAEEKKNLNELGDENRKRKHKITGDLANTLKQNYNSTGGKRTIGTKRIEHLLAKDGYTNNYASNLVSDMENGKISPEEYEMLGGDKLKHQLDRQVKADAAADNAFKAMKAASGDPNAYLSPHTKDSTFGQAHSEKVGY